LDVFLAAPGMVRGQKKGPGHLGADPFLVQKPYGILYDGTGRTGANAAIYSIVEEIKRKCHNLSSLFGINR